MRKILFGYKDDGGLEITEKYEIPFGLIDLRVALAEEAGSVADFRRDHSWVFAAMARELRDDDWCLDDETPIVVEHFRVVQDVES